MGISWNYLVIKVAVKQLETKHEHVAKKRNQQDVVRSVWCDH